MLDLKVLVTEDELNKRINVIARQINKDYEGRKLTIICVLKGAFMFVSDLMKKITVPVEIDFITAFSYENNKSTGTVNLGNGLTENIEGKHVLLVEDIVDSGITIKFLLDMIKQLNPASIKFCVLLNKSQNRKMDDINIDYYGFDIPNQFVLGYGLDYMQEYRNLPYIAVSEN
jgi:hypoxanthine phosphoribosyltransferase